MRRALSPPAALVSLVLGTVALGSPALAQGGGGGGGGTTASGGSITVSPGKIGIGATGTGTITLGAAVATATTITLSDDYQNSVAVATHPASVIVPPGGRTATFSILGGDYPDRTFLVHLTTSISGLVGQFYRTPLPNTDIISITSASQSQSGDLRFTATTDTPVALLSASFNGQSVPLTSRGGGVYQGRGSGFTSGGDIVVQSNLRGCSAKNPLTPTPSHFC